jgi:hypothetical protein
LYSPDRIGFKGYDHAALETLTLLNKFSHGPGFEVGIRSMRITAAEPQINPS